MVRLSFKHLTRKNELAGLFYHIEGILAKLCQKYDKKIADDALELLECWQCCFPGFSWEMMKSQGTPGHHKEGLLWHELPQWSFFLPLPLHLPPSLWY